MLNLFGKELWGNLKHKHRKKIFPILCVFCFLFASLWLGARSTVAPGATETVSPDLPPQNIQVREEPSHIETDDQEIPPTRTIIRRSAGSLQGVEIRTEPLHRPKERSDDEPTTSDLDDRWHVYISGEVRRPGVYALSPGARLYQLVDAAGGLNGFADSTRINMARPLQDGLHIHVPKKGTQKDENAVIFIEPTLIAPWRGGSQRSPNPGTRPLPPR